MYGIAGSQHSSSSEFKIILLVFRGDLKDRSIVLKAPVLELEWLLVGQQAPRVFPRCRHLFWYLLMKAARRLEKIQIAGLNKKNIEYCEANFEQLSVTRTRET